MTYLKTVSENVNDNWYKKTALSLYQSEGIEGFFSHALRYNILEWLIRQVTSNPIVGLDETNISNYSGEISAIRNAGYYYIDNIIDWLEKELDKQ